MLLERLGHKADGDGVLAIETLHQRPADYLQISPVTVSGDGGKPEVCEIGHEDGFALFGMTKGGDEFTALVYADLDSGRATAVRIAEAMRTTHEIDGHSVSVGVCVGVVQIGRPDRTPPDSTTVAGSDTADEDELMRLADRAMYTAKREGKAGIYAYDTAGTLSAGPSGSDHASRGTKPKMVAGEPDPARLIGPPTRT